MPNAINILLVLLLLFLGYAKTPNNGENWTFPAPTTG